MRVVCLLQLSQLRGRQAGCKGGLVQCFCLAVNQLSVGGGLKVQRGMRNFQVLFSPVSCSPLIPISGK